MAEQFHEAAEVGLGTVVLSGTLASQTLPSVPSTAKHALVFVSSGTLYVENDGTEADANAMPYGASGVSTYFVVKNSQQLLSEIRIFSSAAVTVIVAYGK